MGHDTVVQEFFATYATALLARDAKAVARHYAVPALIAFPDQLLVVSELTQTERFFTNTFEQYRDVTQTSPQVRLIAETQHSLWADVTWSYDGAAAERNMYQLVKTGDTWKIAVLTPLQV